MRLRWQWRRAVPVSGGAMTTSLREVHERLVRLGAEPVSAGDTGWQELQRRLPDRPLSWSGRVMAWLRRPAVALMTTGLLSTGIAHAAGVQPVRGGVDWLVGGITSIVGTTNEPSIEREARRGRGQSGFREGAGSWEENRRRLAGGAGVESDQERDADGGGRGVAPAPGGAGSGDHQDRDEPRDDDRDEREDDDGDDGDEREDRYDDDDEGRFGPDDEEAEERDDEELEEPGDEPLDPERAGDEDDRGELDRDAYDEVDPEEDRD